MSLARHPDPAHAPPRPEAAPDAGGCDRRLILLSPSDNCLAVAAPIRHGESIQVDGHSVTVDADIGTGHKLARRDIAAGEKILKYGAVIGSATQPIARGQWVHLHNLASDYIPTYTLPEGHS